MDSFASVSGHVSTLMKQLGNEKIPSLHNRVLLPLQVTTDRDPELEVGTHTHNLAVLQWSSLDAEYIHCFSAESHRGSCSNPPSRTQ